MKKIDSSYFETGLICNNELILFSKDYNVSVVVDLNESKLKDVDLLPYENINKQNLVSEIKTWNDSIYFIPRNAQYLYIKNNNGFQTVDFSEYFNMNLNNKFMSSLISNDYLFLFGHWAPYIIGINLKERVIDFAYKVPDEYISMKEEKNDAYFGDYWRENNVVYLPFLSGEYIAKMDLNTLQIDWTKILGNTGFSSISKLEDGRFILTARNGKGLVIYDEENKTTKNYFEDVNLKYSLGIFLNGQYKWIPCYGGKSYLFDVQKQTYEETKPGYVSVIKNEDKCLGVREIGVDIIDKYGKCLDFPQIDYTYIDELISEKIQENKRLIESTLLTENQLIGLDSFLGVITKKSVE